MADKTLFQEMLVAEHNKALAELIQLKSFRFYMSELLGYCKTFQSAFDEKGNVAAFQNGKQDVGLKIFNDIMVLGPESYVQMCKEEAELIALQSQLKPKKEKEVKNGE